MALRNPFAAEDEATGTGKYIDPLGNYIHKKDPLGLFKGRGGGGSATPVGDQYAALTREMWASYVKEWMPYENKLIDYATSETAVPDAMNEASAFVDQAFDQQRAASERRMRGLGISLDADEQRVADRSFGLSKSLADVQAQNLARDQTRMRQRAVLGNPAPALPDIG